MNVLVGTNCEILMLYFSLQGEYINHTADKWTCHIIHISQVCFYLYLNLKAIMRFKGSPRLYGFYLLMSQCGILFILILEQQS